MDELKEAVVAMQAKAATLRAEADAIDAELQSLAAHLQTTTAVVAPNGEAKGRKHHYSPKSLTWQQIAKALKAGPKTAPELDVIIGSTTAPMCLADMQRAGVVIKTGGNKTRGVRAAYELASVQ